MKKYTEITAKNIIESAGGKIVNKHVTIKSGALGLHNLGAVDYLVNKHKYTVTWTK